MLTVDRGNPYLNMRSNVPMCREFVRSMKVFGRHFVEREERGAPRASTDQGGFF